MKRSNLFLALFIVAALVSNTDLSAQRRGGGGNVRSSANSSVNRNNNVNRNTNTNVNVNRNINVNNNVNVHNDYHGGGYYGGGCCYHPVAVAAAVTATAVVTAAVVGSIVAKPPATGCVTQIVGGLSYTQCGSTWYQPQMSGTNTTYVVVNAPR